MSGWLLDTNVISELRKPDGNQNVRTWVEARPAHELFLCTVTLAEIRYGIGSLSDPNKRHTLTHWLDSTLRPWFADRILEIDEQAILRWREMVEIGRKAGHTFSQPDLFIAAVADIHQLCIVTRNDRDFQHCDIPVLNPWLAAED
jgi:predicted nucleic acid-binding protein